MSWVATKTPDGWYCPVCGHYHEVEGGPAVWKSLADGTRKLSADIIEYAMTCEKCAETVYVSEEY